MPPLKNSLLRSGSPIKRNPTNRSKRYTRRQLAFQRLEDRRLLAIDFELVKDFDAFLSAGHSNPDNFVEVGSRLYFTARTSETGTELWKTDGTVVGTALVRDIRAGSNSSYPSDLTNVNGVLYFSASAATGTRELWRSDGTLVGTSLVKATGTRGEAEYPSNLSNVNGTLFFTANDGTNGKELWKSNGTPTGTTIVKDINSVGFGAAGPSNLTSVGNKLFFTVDDHTNGEELWKSDGTALGTILVRDIAVGAGSASPSGLTNVGGVLYFSAYETTSGRELWRSDGTFTGTTLVRDLEPGNSTDLGPSSLSNVNGKLYFSTWNLDTRVAGFWKSDGTYTGTTLIKNFEGYPPLEFTSVRESIFFAQNDGSSGGGLWKSDGTSAGTTLIKQDPLGPWNLTNVGGKLYFAANDRRDQGYELWKSDGTPNGTVQVENIYPDSGSSLPSSLTSFGGKLLFAADDGEHGRELWSSDGTLQGTILIKDINITGSDGSRPSNLADVGGTLFFTTGDYTAGYSLWKSTGSQSGTVHVKDFPIGDRPFSFTSTGDLLFLETIESGKKKLWRSDGSPRGTIPLLPIGIDPGNFGFFPSDLANVGGILYFTANDGTNGYKLWKSDGTATGTVLVKDIQRGGPDASSEPFQLTNVAGTLYFTANDVTGGRSLWKSDGSPTGTVEIQDIKADGNGSHPMELTNVNGLLFFTGSSITGGRSLWKSDGTSTGTAEVLNIRADLNGANPRWLTAMNNTIYFSAQHGSSGVELWKSDGTATGTVLVKNIFPGLTGSYPSYLKTIGGTLYFVADDPTAGRELWRSDGTGEGTILVKDIRPGLLSSFSEPVNLLEHAGMLYFSAYDGIGKPSLWKSDGTTEGTLPITNRTNQRSPEPMAAAVAGGNLFFVGITNEFGSELYRLNVVPDTGELGGHIWQDLNANGTIDENEPSLPGVTVFLDLNNNETKEVNEPIAISDANGNYKFSNLLQGEYIVRQVPIPDSFGDPNSSDENSPGIVELRGASEATFNPVGASIEFVVSEAEFGVNLEDIVVYSNEKQVDSAQISRTSASVIRISNLLVEGLNEIKFAAIDKARLPIETSVSLWAGSHTLVVIVDDEGNQRLSDSKVVAELLADNAVSALATTINGMATLLNLPADLIKLTASNSTQKNYGVSIERGDVGNTRVVARGIGGSSNIDNNDFHDGVRGWDVTSGMFQEHNMDGVLSVNNFKVAETSRTIKVGSGASSLSLKYKFEPNGSVLNRYIITFRNQSDPVNPVVTSFLGDSRQDQWQFASVAAREGDIVRIEIKLYQFDPTAPAPGMVIDFVKVQKSSFINFKLQDVDKTKLQFLSVSESKSTFVAGSFDLDTSLLKTIYDPTNTNFYLEIVQGNNIALANFVGQLDDSDGTVKGTSTLKYDPIGHINDLPSRLFEISSANGLDLTRDSTLLLRLFVKIKDKVGNVIEEIRSNEISVQLLVEYSRTNRYGQPPSGQDDSSFLPSGHPAFGDNWVLPSVKQVLEQFDNSKVFYNDFSDMNGGNFPPHRDHEYGNEVDVQLPEKGPLTNKRDEYLAREIIRQLDSAVGQHISTAYLTLIDAPKFKNAIAGVTLCDNGRPATKVIKQADRHEDHFHWIVKPIDPPTSISCKSDLSVKGTADKKAVKAGDVVEFQFALKLESGASELNKPGNPKSGPKFETNFNPTHWEFATIDGKDSVTVLRELYGNESVVEIDRSTNKLTIYLGTILGSGDQHKVDIKVKVRAKKIDTSPVPVPVFVYATITGANDELNSVNNVTDFISVNFEPREANLAVQIIALNTQVRVKITNYGPDAATHLEPLIVASFIGGGIPKIFSASGLHAGEQVVIGSQGLDATWKIPVLESNQSREIILSVAELPVTLPPTTFIYSVLAKFGLEQLDPDLSNNIASASYPANRGGGGEGPDNQFSSRWRISKPAVHYYQVSVTANGVLTGLDFGNFQVATISGYAFHDANRDKLFDPSDPLIANRTMFIDKNENGKLDLGEPTQSTDSNGFYQFDFLHPGNYLIVQDLPTQWLPTNPSGSSQRVGIKSGDYVENVDFGSYLVANASITGSLFNDINANGQRDSSEPAIAGRIVYLDSDNDHQLDENERRTTTDEVGNYQFTLLVPNQYIVSQIIPQAWQQSLPLDPSYVVTLSSGEHVTALNFASRIQTWQNLRQSEDVDDDLFISPIDVLIIINYLNSNNPSVLPPAPPRISPPHFLDVDGDNFVSPLDVLIVINYINKQGSSGGGEAESSAISIRDRLFSERSSLEDSLNPAFDFDKHFVMDDWFNTSDRFQIKLKRKRG